MSLLKFSREFCEIYETVLILVLILSLVPWFIRFLLKNLFFSKFGQKGPKIGYFCHFFLSIKTMQNKSFFLFFTLSRKPMSGKILVLELLPKMFLVNQIPGFLKVSYLCNKKVIFFWGIKLSFCLQINIRNSYKFVILLLVGVNKRAQSSQNSKFVISL